LIIKTVLVFGFKTQRYLKRKRKSTFHGYLTLQIIRGVIDPFIIINEKCPAIPLQVPPTPKA